MSWSEKEQIQTTFVALQLQMALAVKNPPANAGGGFRPWVGNSPWRRGLATHYPICLENPTDRGMSLQPATT